MKHLKPIDGQLSACMVFVNVPAAHQGILTCTRPCSITMISATGQNAVEQGRRHRSNRLAQVRLRFGAAPRGARRASGNCATFARSAAPRSTCSTRTTFTPLHNAAWNGQSRNDGVVTRCRCRYQCQHLRRRHAAVKLAQKQRPGRRSPSLFRPNCRLSIGR